MKSKSTNMFDETVFIHPLLKIIDAVPIIFTKQYKSNKPIKYLCTF